MTFTDDIAVVREALLHWGVDECCGNDVKAALDRMEQEYEDLTGGPSNEEAQAIATRLAEAERELEEHSEKLEDCPGYKLGLSTDC